jgi:hypothetical protein
MHEAAAFRHIILFLRMQHCAHLATYVYSESETHTMARVVMCVHDLHTHSFRYLQSASTLAAHNVIIITEMESLQKCRSLVDNTRRRFHMFRC